MLNQIHKFGFYLLKKLGALDKQYWWIKFIFITLFVALPTLFFGKYNLSEYWALEQRLNNLQAEIDQVRPLLEEDTERLNRLREQDKTVEAIARERYLMKETGEEIFVLKRDSTSHKTD